MNTETKTYRKSTAELIAAEHASKPIAPLPLSVIPNYMGIHLCSVEAMSWVEQDDGQLVSVTIHFIPETSNQQSAKGYVGGGRHEPGGFLDPHAKKE